VHDAEHPMEVRLRQLLLHFCLDHLEEMSDRHLSLVARLVSLNFPRDLLQAVLGIPDPFGVDPYRYY
jgi:hypothetical protein